MAKWGTTQEIETRNRIRVACAAYAYEVDNDPIMTDAAFDSLAASIDLTVQTTNKGMDSWFKRNFIPDTGQWVHKHPDKAGLVRTLAIIRRVNNIDTFGVGGIK